MDRAPGLSVRLKLTLSYAGFLMLAGAVLLAAGYFSLSRGVHPGVVFLVRSHADLVHRLGHHGERWLDDVGPLGVVEPEQRHLFGAADAPLAEALQGAE